MSRVTIVMYHYVREFANSRIPGIKGRNISEFKAQLDHIGRNFTVVTAEQVVNAIKDGELFPRNAAWLTFDDGYLDHYINVFPLLHERGWQGSFFPTAQATLCGELLDVNKIHFILAANPNPASIIAEIKAFIEERRDGVNIRSFENYWDEFAQAGRFSTPDIVFIKRVLQHALPEFARYELTDALFRRHISGDPAAFAAELYMTAEQLRLMIRCGMYVGNHSVRHDWLNRLPADKQKADVDKSLDFLKVLGAPVNDWIMCYPYGGYNADLIEYLQSRNCAVGLTTNVGVAQLGVDKPLLLPRLDTNDLPIS